MNWLLRAYADIYKVTLGQSDIYDPSVKCNKHLRSGEKSFKQRRSR
jgi:hypothetical protein